MEKDQDDSQFGPLLHLAQSGNETAKEKLFSLLYGELRIIAAQCFRGERKDHTLQPTALVHEAYCRLIQEIDRDWQNREHFLAVAAQMMRHILVDWARARTAEKRGGRLQRVELHEHIAGARNWSELIMDLDNALKELAEKDPRAARVVELRFFGGLTDEEIASILGVTDRTVSRDWRFARAWLEGALSKDGGDGASWLRAASGE